MNIITISREFGSGGREIGKIISECLGYKYYDKEIISEVASNNQLNEKYVDKTIHTSLTKNVKLRYNHSFFDPKSLNVAQANLLIEQKKVIENLGKFGENMVVVGRNADHILSEYNPFKLFVCASLDSKIKRCKEREEYNGVLSDKEIEKNIRRIDNVRKETCILIAGNNWGERSNYDLIVNTTNTNIEEISKALAEYIKVYFEKIRKF